MLPAMTALRGSPLDVMYKNPEYSPAETDGRDRNHENQLMRLANTAVSVVADANVLQVDVAVVTVVLLPNMSITSAISAGAMMRMPAPMMVYTSICFADVTLPGLPADVRYKKLAHKTMSTAIGGMSFTWRNRATLQTITVTSLVPSGLTVLKSKQSGAPLHP